MRKIKLAAIAAIAMLGATAATGLANALPIMPIDNLVATGADTAMEADKVAWVCGPYRCHRVYHRPVLYGGPVYHRWGWHHRQYAYGWRRW